MTDLRSSTLQVSASMPSILVVDDTLENLHFFVSVLSAQGYHVRAFRNSRVALDSARALPPDLVLLDICMPVMDGYQVCEQLKADQATRDIPVIFISALDEVFDKVKAFSVGGVDYITKPIQFEELIARVETHLTLRSLQTELEEKNAQLEDRNLQLEREISRRKQVEEELRQLAMRDPLTDAYNRRTFFDLAEKEMARVKRHGGYLSMIMLDLDHFKQVNDVFGHQMGDEALKRLTVLCQENIRGVDIFARFGGEEFVILLPETSIAESQATAERLRREIAAQAIEFGGQRLSFTASLGVAGLEGEPDLSLDELIARADAALYRSKQAGRNQVSVW